MNRILNEASKEGYGIAAPNVFNQDMILAAFEAADEVKSPLILDCLGSTDLYAMAELTRFYCSRFPNVPVALNLDHGKTFEEAVEAIRAGYTSVMVDRSQLPFEENVRQTAEIVKMAHAVGVSVEAELGHVGRGINYDEDRDKGLTTVEEAVEFVKKTKVDCLAVAIGTAHGRYIGTPRLDFERLANLKKNIQIPLVLHGASSTGDENLKKAVETGITKVNISTDLKVAGAEEVKRYFDEEEFHDLLTLTQRGIIGWKNMLKHYMILFHSNNRI